MSSDDYARGSHYSSSRKPGGPKSHSYSPSSNYNYGNGNSHGNSTHGNHGNSGGSSGGSSSSGGKPFHRKPGPPFKRDNFGSSGSSDKLIKQNDLIISLLKEIRDRLPAPPNAPKTSDADLNTVIEDIEAQVSDAGYDQPDDIAEDDTAEEENSSSESDPEEQDNAIPDVYEDDDLDNKVNGNY